MFFKKVQLRSVIVCLACIIYASPSLAEDFSAYEDFIDWTSGYSPRPPASVEGDMLRLFRNGEATATDLFVLSQLMKDRPALVKEVRVLPFDLLRRAAREGSQAARVRLASMALLEPDEYRAAGGSMTNDEALCVLEQAASAGHRDALLYLGMIYMSGTGGLETNLPAAEEYLVRAVKERSNYALFALAYVYHQLGNKAKFDNLIRRAVAVGDPEAMVFLAAQLIKSKEAHERAAVPRLLTAADLIRPHQPQTLYLLGRVYQHGVGINPSSELAFQCFSQSARLGNADAMAEVGRALVRGIGVQKDVPSGLAYLKQAAAQGSARGQLWLAELLLEGKVVPRNKSRARELLRAASEAGITKAAELLSTHWPNEHS